MSEPRISFIGGRRMRSRKLIDAMESRHRIKFPAAYVEMVMEHDGAQIEPSAFIHRNPMNAKLEVLSCSYLHPFGGKEKGWCMKSMNPLKTGLPPGTIIFASDAGAGSLAFDFASEDGGKIPIVYIHAYFHEGRYIDQVFDSFEDYLGSVIEEPQGRWQTIAKPVGGHPTTPDRIAAFEKEFSCKLPPALIELISENDGCRIEPSTFVAAHLDGTRVRARIHEILALDPLPGGAPSIFHMNRELGHIHPKFRIFAHDNAGELFLLDYRPEHDEPEIFMTQGGIHSGKPLVQIAWRFEDILPRVLGPHKEDWCRDTQYMD